LSPYISLSKRLRVQSIFREENRIEIIARLLDDDEMAYVIFKFLNVRYGSGDWRQRRRALSILMSVLFEFYHVCLRPYEDSKRRLHGDV